eukprot:1292160-Rhodomonas_salina.1
MLVRVAGTDSERCCISRTYLRRLYMHAPMRYKNIPPYAYAPSHRLQHPAITHCAQARPRGGVSGSGSFRYSKPPFFCTKPPSFYTAKSNLDPGTNRADAACASDTPDPVLENTEYEKGPPADNLLGPFLVEFAKWRSKAKERK